MYHEALQIESHYRDMMMIWKRSRLKIHERWEAQRDREQASVDVWKQADKVAAAAWERE
jgi:hypothetical protein